MQERSTTKQDSHFIRDELLVVVDHILLSEQVEAETLKCLRSDLRLS
jgi:hypothetical protein